MGDDELSGELTVAYGIGDRVVGVALVIALLAAFAVLESAAARGLLILATIVGVVGTLQAFIRRMVLFENHFVVRNAVGRTQSFRYTEIREISFDPSSVLTIWLHSGRAIRFPAKLRQISSARDLLLRRIPLDAE